MRKMLGALQSRRAEKRSLLDMAEHLNPGRWIAVPPRRTVWFAAGTSLPDALVGTASKISKSQRALDAANSWRDPFTKALRALRGGRRSINIPVTGQRQGSATILIRPNGARTKWLALTPGSRALRVGNPDAFGSEYVDCRKRFEKCVPSPKFSVSQDGRLLEEEWCDGVLLADLPLERRLLPTATLLYDYARLVGAEAFPDAQSWWRCLPALLSKVVLPQPLQDCLHDERVFRLVELPLLMPSQGDCGPHNVIVAESGAPTVIDFDSVGWFPIWLDPIQLSLRASAGAEPDSPLTLGLTIALDGVWTAAGLDDCEGLSPRHWLFLAAIGRAWRYYRKALIRSGDSAVPNPNEFAQRVERHAQAQAVDALPR